MRSPSKKAIHWPPTNKKQPHKNTKKKAIFTGLDGDIGGGGKRVGEPTRATKIFTIITKGNREKRFRKGTKSGKNFWELLRKLGKTRIHAGWGNSRNAEGQPEKRSLKVFPEERCAAKTNARKGPEASN